MNGDLIQRYTIRTGLEFCKAQFVKFITPFASDNTKVEHWTGLDDCYKLNYKLNKLNTGEKRKERVGL